MIRAAAAPRRKKQPEEKPKYTICLPYVSGVGEDLRRVCRKYDIRTAFSTVSTLRQQLTKVKDVDPLLSRAGVVYSIPCSDCEQYYIGETKRALGTRLKEHQANTRRGETEKSAIAEHAWKKDHRPAWDETSILAQARNENTLRIKEAFCIMTAEQEKILNRDRGTAISDSWKPFLWRWSQPRATPQLRNPAQLSS